MNLSLPKNLGIFLVACAFLSLFATTVLSQSDADTTPDTSEDSYDEVSDYESCYPEDEPDVFDHHEVVAAGCGGKIQEVWDDGCGRLFVNHDRDHQCGLAQNPVISNADEEDGWGCVCSASQCYPPPQPKDVKDDTLSPKNVFENPQKLKLPVNLGWNDINAWAQANSNPTGECKVESYNYAIRDSSGAKIAEKPVPSPSANPVLNAIPEQCLLFPSAQYQWQVQACQDDNGKCSSWSEQKTFQTSSAPELKSPYDPDWEEEKSGRTPFPAEFKWCEHPDSSVKSYALNVYEAKKDGTRGSRVPPGRALSREQTEYFDDFAEGGFNQFGKGASYFWEIGACTDIRAEQCEIFSQLWSLVPGGKLEAPVPLSPDPGAFVNMTDTLQWQQVVFATHYVVHITGESIDKDFFTRGIFSLESIWQELALTTSYQWKVAPCGGPPVSQDIKDCENEGGTVPWSKEQRFITTGAQPLKLKTAPTEAGVAGIPLTLDWDDAGGAASYEVVITPALPPRIVSEKSETTLQYPMLETKTLYSFAVKTCADKLAKVCGPEALGSFTTVTLAAPLLTVPSPGKKEFDPSTAIVWNKVFSGNFYSYTLTFLSPSPQEVSSECKKTHEVAGQIIAENGATVRFRCIGDYTLAVQACIDSKCEEHGQAAVLPLTVEKLLARTGGLVPCDRGNDNLATPYDERKECGLGSVFLLIRNLIDFALWKLSLIIVIVMLIVTGAIMFFSFGGIDVMTKVRSIWRSVGIGVLILLFSWLFLNILLDLVGFNITFYGKWYALPL